MTTEQSETAADRLEEYIDDLRHNSDRRSYPGFDTRTANTIANELEEMVEDLREK